MALKLKRVQERVEGLLLSDRLALRRDRPGVEDDILDESSGSLVPAPDDVTVLWTGLGAVLADREDGTYRVMLPMDAPLLYEGDMIDVLESAQDPQLAGKRVRVRTVPRGGTFAVLRTVHAELMA